MTQQEKIDLIVKLRDSGKTWWEIKAQIGNISIEMLRYRYKQAKGFLKPKNDGMDLRDYFAAKAMQAMMTAGFWNWEIPEEDANRCYTQADAMMKAREQ